MKRVLPLLILLPALGALGTLRAQERQSGTVPVAFTLSGLLLGTRTDLILVGSRETVSGQWLGGSVELRLGPLVFAASGAKGRLEPGASGAALERDGGEIRGLVRLEPHRVFGIEGGYTVRAYNSAAGHQEWKLPAVGVRLAAPLGNPSLQAFVRGLYMPSATVSLAAGQTGGVTEWDLGLSGEAGFVVAPTRVPLVVGASYRFERFDFPGGAATGRVEQFEAAGVWVGFRFGRSSR